MLPQASTQVASEVVTQGIQLSITWDDMLSFQARHFPKAAILHSSAVTEAFVKNDPNQLDPYEDGSQRSLTAEQIAMFRHSELQDLIKQHRVQMENADDGSTLADDIDIQLVKTRISQSGDVESQPVENRMTWDRSSVRDERKVIHTPPKVTNSSKKKRKRGKPQAFYKPEKQDKEQFTHDGDQRTFRRICREADELSQNEVELDY